MKNIIKSGDQLRALLEKIVSVSVKDAHKAINEASIPYLNEQEEAEEEEAEEEAEEEVEEETEEEAEEEAEEETEEEAEDEGDEEKDPMKRQPRKEPKRPRTGSEVKLSHILYDINQIRSGRSLKDPEVRDNLKDYFDRLGKPERIALSEFLAGLTDVIVKGVPAEDAETPDEEVSIKEPKKNQEKEADSEEEPSKEKPIEDTTPPIQVRR
jgi:hypothetical protein